MNVLKHKAVRIGVIALGACVIGVVLFFGGIKVLEFATKDWFKCTSQDLTDPDCIR